MAGATDGGSASLGIATLDPVSTRTRLALAAAVSGAAGAAVGLAPLSWLLASGAAAAALALLAWPVLAVAVAAFAVPFGSLAGVQVGPGTATLTPLVLAIGCAALATRWSANSSRRIGASTHHISTPVRAVAVAVAAYIVIVALAAARAPDYAAAAVEGARWVELALAAVLAFVVCRASNGKVAPSHLVASALLLAGLAGASVGISQSVARAGPEAFGILGGRLVRAYGTFGQPNPFGGYMNMVWPLGAALVFYSAVGRATRIRHDIVPWWLAAIAAAATLASVAGLVLSWSRGAWLAAVAAGTAMAMLTLLRYARPPWPPWGLAGAGAFAALALVALSAPTTSPLGSGSLSSGALDRVSSIGTTFAAWNVADAEVTDANYATIERVAHWEAAYLMWADRPWLGQGPGQYEQAYARFRLPRWSEPLGHAHNVYLHTLAETGLVGLAAYLAMIGASLALAARVAWVRAGTFAGSVGLGLLGFLVALAVHGVVDNLHVHDMTVTLGLVLGLAAAADVGAQEGLPSASGLRAARN